MDPLPLFFHPDREGEGAHFWLEESTARHVAQVLRMGPGQRIRLTDGQGQEAAARIREARKAKVEVQIESLIHHPRPEPRIQLAIGFTRNAARNEWLLEKATELGVQDLIPLKTARALPWKSRPPRWTQILRSALIQSGQFYLPRIHPGVSLEQALDMAGDSPGKYLAHCLSQRPREPLLSVLKPSQNSLILIGPEGDFSPEEIDLAESRGAISVHLGSQRMRTETAALAALAALHLINTMPT